MITGAAGGSPSYQPKLEFSKDNVTGLKKRGRVLKINGDTLPYKMEFFNKNAVSNKDPVEHESE